MRGLIMALGQMGYREVQVGVRAVGGGILAS